VFVEFTKNLLRKEKKRLLTRQVNVTRFAGKRYCKQYFVTVTFTYKAVSVYLPSLAVSFVVIFTNFSQLYQLTFLSVPLKR